MRCELTTGFYGMHNTKLIVDFRVNGLVHVISIILSLTL